MEIDAWYHSFVSTKPNPLPDQARHDRRVSLLQQPHGEGNSDPPSLQPIQDVLPERTIPICPPCATIARRAKSYTDFYHVAKAQLRKDSVIRRSRRNSSDKVLLDKPSQSKNDDVAEGLLNSSHARYQLYRDQLRLANNNLDSLLEDTSSNLALLSDLTASFKAVEMQTSSFRARCEGLLAEQKRVRALADDIAGNLQFYNYLEPITKRLNAPGAGRLVRGHDFPQMLNNLDQCLDYMQAHPRHVEAASYQSRYRLLLTRALTLIRVHFTDTLRETAAEVSRRIADRQLNDTTMSTLLHAKFRVGASEMKRLGLEIKKRAVPSPDAAPGAQGEYQSLMNELHQTYSAARGRLLVPLVRKKMADIALAQSTSKDLVAFVRSTVGYMRGICLDEYDLWYEWFEGDEGLYEFLEAMCEPLYDYLRPRTIHETQLPKLCEMCSLIQSRYMENQDEDAEIDESNHLDFSGLIRPALEDAQTRLVFLTLSVLRDQIERYKPKPSDLDYPTKNRRVSLSGIKSKSPALSGRRESSHSPQTAVPKTPQVVDEEGTDAADLRWRYDAGAAFGGWYPTLRKAMWLLSRIYRLVNSTVFDDLAHRIVHQTTISLQYAAGLIASKSTTADSQLFLLRQLLILKEQIVAFDIEYVTPEVNFDFSSVTNTFWELRERGGLFNPRNLMKLVGSGLIPRVVENMLDAKVELDGRLRTVIHEFTNGFADTMTEAVSEKAMSKSGFNAGIAVQAVRKAVEKEVPSLRGKLEDYLDDVRTQETLVGAVEDQVLQNYEEFFERHRSRAQANGNAVSKKGKGREDGVSDPDTFADWATSIFAVGRVGADQEQDNGSFSLSRSTST